MFDMPDDARCRKFADYVVNNFVAADSDFSSTSCNIRYCQFTVKVAYNSKIDT